MSSGSWRRRSSRATRIVSARAKSPSSLTVTVLSDALGAGRISVDAILDRDAASAFTLPVTPTTASMSLTTASTPSPASVAVERLRVGDLRRAGWEGPGLQVRANGSATFSVYHRFTTVAEANKLLAQLSRRDGPFGQLTLRRQRSPLATTITLRGPGDFRQGLAAFGDAKLAQLTGSGAFGVTDAEVLRQTGAASIDGVLRITVVTDLVGSRASQKLSVGKATPLSASGRQRHWVAAGGFGAAIVTLALYVGLRRRKETP